jgi:peptidoglycan/LPS O-acetylase OafA/YrhL
VIATTPRARFSPALRRLLRVAATLASSRIDRVKTEITRRGHDIADVVVSGVVTVMLAILALVFALVAALIAVPAPWRAPACGGLALMLALLAMVYGFRLRSRLRSLRSLNWLAVLGLLVGSAKSGAAGGSCHRENYS